MLRAECVAGLVARACGGRMGPSAPLPGVCLAEDVVRDLLFVWDLPGAAQGGGAPERGAADGARAGAPTKAAKFAKFAKFHLNL